MDILPIDESVAEFWRDLISACLEKDPSKRLPTGELLDRMGGTPIIHKSQGMQEYDCNSWAISYEELPPYFNGVEKMPFPVS